MPPEEQPPSIEQQLSDLQPELRRFVGSLLLNPSDVDDVVQEVNITVWAKKLEFEDGTNFRAWVFKIARFKALASHRDAIRSRLSLFGDDLSSTIEGMMISAPTQPDEKAEALRVCMRQLSSDQVELLEARYARESSLVQLAQKRGISADAAHKAISRLRRQLRQCVEARLKSDQTDPANSTSQENP